MSYLAISGSFEYLSYRSTAIINIYFNSFSAGTVLIRLQSAFPKVYFSEGSLFRRFIVPKVHCAEKKVYCAEGLLVRRVIYPK